MSCVLSALVGSQPIHFEVKNAVGREWRCRLVDALLSSFDASINLEAQQRAGACIALPVLKAQPYGNNIKNDQNLLNVINTLVEKIRGNIKVGQFVIPNTFLVINSVSFSPLPRSQRP